MATDVLLVNPNRMRPPIAPLALEYLATALEAASLTCAVCDLCFAADPAGALAADLQAHSPRLVALTMRNADDCYCATQHSFIPEVQEWVSLVRSHSDAPVVLGGAGFSTAPEAIVALTGADVGVAGDGEEALVRLARGEDVGSIPGLIWREGDAVRRNAPVYGPFGQQALRRDHLDNARYFREGGQGGLETKRGCPMSCLYCADPLSKGSLARLRPPQALVQEARHLLAQGVDAVHLCDSEFNVPLSHAKAVSAAFAEAGLGEQWRWWGYLAPAPFDAELAGLMARAGCQGINFGADSGDPAMLQRLGRAHTPDDIGQAARLCREHRLACMFDLLLGGPGETRESLRRTIELMKHVEPDCIGVSFGMRLYAGTGVARLLEAEFSEANANLRGRIADNGHMAWPVYYVEAGLGDDAIATLRDLIGGDQRFFFGWPDDDQPDYNYDDNQVLTDAIRDGARGAYWDILRRMT